MMIARTYALMLLTSGLALALPVAVLAADVTAITPVATPAATKSQTVVSLSASDQKQVDQDLLVASLRIEVEDKDPRKAQDLINKAMQKAVETAKSVQGLKVSTGQYYVYQYDPNPSPRPLSHAEQMKRMVWKGSQTIDLQSKESQSVLDVAGKLQDVGFLMNGMNYTLSPEKEEEQKDILLNGAIQKIQKKAELIAKALGKSGFDIEEVSVEGANMPAPQPVMMMKAARMDMAVAEAAAPVEAPVAMPGQSMVTLSVSARVVLK